MPQRTAMRMAIDSTPAKHPAHTQIHALPLCRQRYFLTEDMLQNHMHIASVPHRGIQFVRIHYLLDLIGVVPASRGRRDGNVAGEGGRGTAGTANAADAGASQAADSVVHLSSPFWRGRGLNFTALDLAMDQLNTLGK